MDCAIGEDSLFFFLFFVSDFGSINESMAIDQEHIELTPHAWTTRLYSDARQHPMETGSSSGLWLTTEPKGVH